ncbi:sigma-54 dependent transcriptional regulator [Algivirga pacifica]|uniref:Sigma-54 dependent transcriptional regulator n=1 Tax=Algivirga pacifica TaxID=1162670 RepID=A0ABP9DJT1_9BACT
MHIEEKDTKLFIIEQDEYYQKMFRHYLGDNPAYQLTLFHDRQTFIHRLKQETPEVIFTDIHFTNIDPIQWIQEIKASCPMGNIIVTSTIKEPNIIISLFKEGIVDYIIKDQHNLQPLLHQSICRAKSLRLNTRETTSTIFQKEHIPLDARIRERFKKTIIGDSSSMEKVFNLLEKTPNNNITVSLFGETGTGKEVVAHAIHQQSNRSKGPFVAVNISAIPEQLLESELFGHEKGAFTGAISRRVGKFEEANGGTLFLDEIGEMSIHLQSKLLRVVQEKELTRIGSNETIRLDVRIITATHRNLSQEVKKGNFREDLFYRLMGIPIELPPLRKREDDILKISHFFIKEFSKENRLEKDVSLSKGAERKLMSYQYPGNIRELKAIIELAAVMCNDNNIREKDIQFPQTEDMESLILQEKTLKEYTFQIVEYFMDKYNNNVLDVAKRLNIGKSTIYRYLKDMEEVEDKEMSRL